MLLHIQCGLYPLKVQNDMKQMSLFEEIESHPDRSPIPVEIARAYGFSLQRYETDNGALYAVQDWIVGVANPAFPADYWKKLKQRTIAKTTTVEKQLVKMPYEAANGKTYQMDFATEEALYFITQRMESAPRVTQVLLLFAKLLKQVSDDRQNPEAAALRYREQFRNRLRGMGKDEQYIAAREESGIARNALTEAAKQFIFDIPRYGYATLTNAEYQGLFERTAQQLKAATGLKNARDGMTREALGLLTAIEGAAARYFEERQTVPFDEACTILREMAEEFRPVVEGLQRRLGIDLATGKPLLPG